MHRGRCDGGPFDGKPMTHGTYGYRLAYWRRAPMKAIPGMVTSRDPEIAFGVYTFDVAAKLWRWSAESPGVTTKSRVDNRVA